MKQLNLEKCNSLSDVFFSLIGGKTDDIREIDAFMTTSPLRQLMAASDVERVVKYDGFFADEVVDAIYMLIPSKLQIAPNRTWIMTPQAFRKLNTLQINKPASRCINISFSQAINVYNIFYEKKMRDLVQAIKEEKAKIISKDETKETQIPAKKNTKQTPQTENNEQLKQKKIEKISARLEEIKNLRSSKEISKDERQKLKKEANRLQTAKYRLEHPDAWKKNYKKMDELTPEKQEERKLASRRRNERYRQKHREELKQYFNKRRAVQKAENPEALKEYDKKNNSKARVKANKRRYYEKHTEEIAKKAKENPMSKVYKQRYANKKRFSTQTGAEILSLLQGIINSKIK